MQLPLIYVAHPYGGNVENLGRAELWLERLSQWAPALFWAPWIQLCRLWPDANETRERGLEIDRQCVAMSDGMLMFGRSVSVGMLREKRAARSVLDMTSLVDMDRLLQSQDWCNDLLAWIDTLTKGSDQ